MKIPPQQWCHPQHHQIYQDSHVICCKSWTQCFIHQCMTSNSHLSDINWNGTPTAVNAHPKRQLHGNGHHHQHHPNISDKSHGHAIPLDVGERVTKAIWYIWWPGKTNLANYWTKHHSAAHQRTMQPKYVSSWTQKNHTTKGKYQK